MIRIACVSLCALLALSPLAQADGWWKLPNPFGGDKEEDTPPATRLTLDEADAPTESRSRSGFSAHTQSTNTPTSPSMWQKFKGGTKTFFAKTSKTLTPWKKDEKETSSRYTGSGRVYRRPLFAEKKKKEEGFFSSLFKPKEEPGPQTVSEWIDLPRPY